MVGLFEVETLEVVEEAKERTLQEVVNQQGPPDATVIISIATGEEFEDEAVSEIVERFTEVGEIIIVRYVQVFLLVIDMAGALRLLTQCS